LWGRSPHRLFPYEYCHVRGLFLVWNFWGSIAHESAKCFFVWIWTVISWASGCVKSRGREECVGSADSHSISKLGFQSGRTLKNSVQSCCLWWILVVPCCD
jgi:hypothetical protein